SISEYGNVQTQAKLFKGKSGRPGSNPRRAAWEVGSRLPTHGIPKRLIQQAHSFACRRNRDNTFIAIDFHRGVQCSGAAANTLEKLLRVGTLHEKRLKQLRIVWLAGASYRLSFTGDG